VLYGVSGTQVFSVNTATGAGTPKSNYAGGVLTAAFGSSFVTEAVIPLPAAAWLIAPAFGLLAPWLKRRQATD